MNAARSCLLPFLALVLTAAPDELRFAPDEGAAVTRTFREVTELDVERGVIDMAGEEEQLPDDFGLAVRTERVVVLSDEYVAVSGGRPTRLKRTFDRIDLALTVEESHSDEDDPQATDATGASELEDLTAVFTWDDGEGQYGVAFEDDDGDEDLLAGLEEDADLRGFLPAGEVSEGDEWEVPLEALARVLRPGGDLLIELDLDDVEGEEASVVFCSFWNAAATAEELEGEVDARYAGLVEEDGRELARIELAVKLRATREVLELARGILEAAGVDSEEVGMLDSMEVTYELDGEGVLRWDRDAGRVAALRLEGDVVLTFAISGEDEGESLRMELGFAGRTELTLETERR